MFYNFAIFHQSCNSYYNFAFTTFNRKLTKSLLHILDRENNRDYKNFINIGGKSKKVTLDSIFSRKNLKILLATVLWVIVMLWVCVEVLGLYNMLCFFIVDVATGMLRSNSTAENIEWQDGMFFSFKFLCMKVVGNVKLNEIREISALN